jgi:hypothetical protein
MQKIKRNTIGQVEIIGWLYQYYNTDRRMKFRASSKNVKITKERIPQLHSFSRRTDCA